MGLILAVMNWLIQIPGSSFTANSHISDLKNPGKLSNFLIIFVQPEDLIKPPGHIMNCISSSGYNQMIHQYSNVECTINNFCSRFSDPENILNLPINWSKILATDLDEVERLCTVLLKIGTNSLKKSSLAYATIEFLEPNDRAIIANYLNLSTRIPLPGYADDSRVKFMVQDIESGVPNFGFLDEDECWHLPDLYLSGDRIIDRKVFETGLNAQNSQEIYLEKEEDAMEVGGISCSYRERNYSRN